jgi:hypothetical protein
VREGACIGAATMPQPWTLRLILHAAALATASPTLLCYRNRDVRMCSAPDLCEQQTAVSVPRRLRLLSRDFATLQCALYSSLLLLHARAVVGCRSSFVCVFTAGPSTKLFAWGGGGIWEDMCYERRRAEVCVDETAHHASFIQVFFLTITRWSCKCISIHINRPQTFQVA